MTDAFSRSLRQSRAAACGELVRFLRANPNLSAEERDEWLFTYIAVRRRVTAFAHSYSLLRHHDRFTALRHFCDREVQAQIVEDSAMLTAKALGVSS
jgi:hypothetical protein